ncbi:Cyclomaltodextrinase [compost metagenome]
MPKFNTANPEVKAYLLKVGRYWIEEIGVDGWRLDVANEVSHQFWRDFRTMVKQINPDAYLVGEIMHDSLPWLLGDQFDAVMNYQLTNMLLNFFARGQTDAGQFSRSVGTLLANYPQQITEVSFNLLDSHDTVRFLTVCGGDIRRLKLAFLFLMTFQGTPCIYYGDEIGMDGEYDPHNRKCMEWDPLKQNQDLLEYYRWAIRLRKSNSAFRSSAIKFLEHPEHPALLVYERWDEHDRFLVIMNNSEFPMDAQVSALKSESVWINQELQQPADIGERGELHIPAYGYMLLREV